MDIGINRAEIENKSFNERFYERRRPCIFLSHRSLDKTMVMKIGQYITKAGIDIYLDEYDSLLQSSDSLGKDKEVVSCIQKGLMHSTHVLCILSKSTVSSWWVPYEIGYGEKGEKEIASLKIMDLKKEEIPSYLKIKQCLMGIEDLNNYLSEIVAKLGVEIDKISKFEVDEYNMKTGASIIHESFTRHPLSKYLEQ